ncbi:ACT domain-containing protein [Proteobacteria bacterium 005FR1]|nr:ACT domain-containing protein [Proteobacteria bacterium 005FR1]
MTGETRLDVLLSSLNMRVREERYAFCTTPLSAVTPALLEVVFATVAEPEGLTLVLPVRAAEEFKLRYDGAFRCITLMVHSSLHAVGLTAAVSGRLAERGISANVVAGFYHDHVFVPEDKIDDALSILTALGSP